KTPSLLETLVTLQNQNAPAHPDSTAPQSGKGVSISSQQPVLFKIAQVFSPQQQSPGAPAPQQAAPVMQTTQAPGTTPLPVLAATVSGTTLQGQPIVQIAGKGACVLQTSTPLPL